MGGKLRTCLLILILLCLIQHRVVVRGVWLYQLNFKEISTRLPLDFFCNSLCIPASGEVGNQNVPTVSAGQGGRRTYDISGTGYGIAY